MPNAVGMVASSPSALRKTKSGGVAHKLPHQVLRRNERERKRVQQVNMGFVHLRDRVPHSASSKKLSKVETLREAARYIQHLQDILQGACDKPFEPIVPTSSSPPQEPCSSSGYYSHQVTECTYAPPELYTTQQYYQPSCCSAPCYNRPAFNTHPYAVVKSEGISPNSSYGSSSDNSLDDARYPTKHYLM